MKSLVKVLMVLSLAAVICLPGVALANYTLTAQFGLYDNYPQNFPNAGPVIDTIDAYITAGSVTFAAPPMTDYSGFTSGGWTSQLINPTFGKATTATPRGAVAWDYTFAGSPSNPFTIDVNFFNAGVFCLHEQVTVYAGWQHFDDAYNTEKYIPLGLATPLPPSLLLLGTGLVGLGFLRRRKVKGGLAA